MNCLSTNLTIVAILILLAVLLVRGIGGGGVDFIDNRHERSSHQYDTIRITDVHNKCKSRRHRHTVRVHSKCKVDVSSMKCVGYCTSGVDFTGIVEPKNSVLNDEPRLKLEYYSSCCKPRKVSYQQKKFDCYIYMRQGRDKVLKINTGEKVKISIPIRMKCDCTSSRGIRWLRSLEFLKSVLTKPTRA